MSEFLNAAKPQLLLVDVDGTIVDDSGILMPGAGCLFKLSQLGLRFAICSARPLQSLVKLSSQFEVVHYISATQGTIVAESDSYHKKWNILSTKFLLQSEVNFLLSEGCRRSFEVWLYSSQKWFVCNETNASEEEEKIVGIDAYLLGAGEQLNEVVKAVFVASNEKSRSTIHSTIKHLKSKGLCAAVSKSNYIEITSKTASRHKGAEIIARHSGINPSQMVAVGDSMNDKGMLMFAGRRFSFVNSVDLVRETGAEILPPPKEDGLVKLAMYLEGELRK